MDVWFESMISKDGEGESFKTGRMAISRVTAIAIILIDKD